MADLKLSPEDLALGIALAIVSSSDTPLMMLDGDLRVLAISTSFCRAFGIDRAEGLLLTELGRGEWDVPQLTGLLLATATGPLAVENYEMRLPKRGKTGKTLLVNAHRLNYAGDRRIMILLSILDVTDARAREVQRDDLMREKATLMQELQHRVANSLQIIASVLLQSARRVESAESRSHIFDAHSRVLSVAELQQQLALSSATTVALKLYFTNLCRSIGASMIRDRHKVSIKVDVDQSVVLASLSLNLGLMVTELVINALKHAFPGDGSGAITVAFASQGENWTLRVSDDGVGMPAPAKDIVGGLGTSIIRALAAQVDAEITIDDVGPGTAVSIRHTEDTADSEARPAAV